MMPAFFYAALWGSVCLNTAGIYSHNKKRSIKHHVLFYKKQPETAELELLFYSLQQNKCAKMEADVSLIKRS